MIIHKKQQFEEKFDPQSLYASYEGFSFFSLFEGETTLYQKVILPCLEAKSLDEQSDGITDVIEHVDYRRLKHILLQRHCVIQNDDEVV